MTFLTLQPKSQAQDIEVEVCAKISSNLNDERIGTYVLWCATLLCSRNRKHLQLFEYEISGATIQKIMRIANVIKRKFVSGSYAAPGLNRRVLESLEPRELEGEGHSQLGCFHWDVLIPRDRSQNPTGGHTDYVLDRIS